MAVGVAGVCLGGNAPEGKAGAINAKRSGVAVERDPFWPVGYEPKKPVDAAGARKKALADKNWAEAMKQVSVQGVSSVSGEFYAIINAETKRVGDQVSVEWGGVRYTWKVERIAPPGSVKLRRVSAE